MHAGDPAAFSALADELARRASSDPFVLATLDTAARNGSPLCQALVVNDLNLRLATTDDPAEQSTLLSALREIAEPTREAADLARAYDIHAPARR